MLGLQPFGRQGSHRQVSLVRPRAKAWVLQIFKPNRTQDNGVVDCTRAPSLPTWEKKAGWGSTLCYSCRGFLLGRPFVHFLHCLRSVPFPSFCSRSVSFSGRWTREKNAVLSVFASIPGAPCSQVGPEATPARRGYHSTDLHCVANELPLLL